MGATAGLVTCAVVLIVFLVAKKRLKGYINYLLTCVGEINEENLKEKEFNWMMQKENIKEVNTNLFLEQVHLRSIY